MSCQCIWTHQLSDIYTDSNVGPGLLSTAECTVLVISANLPLMKPLFSLWSTKARASYGRKRQYSEIEGPFPPTSLSPQSKPLSTTLSEKRVWADVVKTEISQAEHNPGHPLSDLELQNNQVGVRTEISQRTELRQSTVPTCDNWKTWKYMYRWTKAASGLSR